MGINLNCTYRFHLVVVIRQKLRQKLDLPRSTSNKNPGQIKIVFTSSQFTEHIQHQVLRQIQQEITNSCNLLFFLRNFKLKTEVIID